jgi:rhodanese-related sulfurtransferase
MANLTGFFRARYVALLMFLVLFLGGCASAISSSDLLSRLGDDTAELAVVDVRTGFEFNKGHLPGAVNISLLVLPFQLAKVPVKGKDDPVVVYCSHGPRAGLAGFILRLAGFKEVLLLRGDMTDWKSSGLVVEQ